MLDPGKVKRAERLIATGEFTRRQISHMAGISRGSVDAIATGKRRCRRRKDTEEPRGPLNRCLTCGARVYGDCIACDVRRRLAEEKQPDDTQRGGGQNH